MRSEHDLIPGAFSKMTFLTSGKTQIYYRTYQKFFEIITQIGGFVNGIIYFTTIILYICSNNLIMWQCIFNSISANELEQRLSKPKIKRSRTIFISNENININTNANNININRSIEDEERNNNSNHINGRNINN